MTRRRRIAALLGTVGIVAAGTAGSLEAQTIRLLLAGDSISAAPPLVVTTSGVGADAGSVTIQIEISTEPAFQNPLYFDLKAGTDATFFLRRLLPEHTVVFFRVRLVSESNVVLATEVTQHPVRSWLRLISPDRLLFTRRPQFVWSSSALTLPPGPWVYDLSVINSATNNVDFFVPGIGDTAFIPQQPLEANTSYRWRVRARAINSVAADEVTRTSATTFVISSSEQPIATLFHQNFPNPFPSALSAVTCFWFDLARTAEVRLTIYDIRLRLVKHIIPGALGSLLPPGAYGRQEAAASNCDGRVVWDGTDDRGNVVPRGVYLARFEADGVNDVKKILFLGR